MKFYICGSRKKDLAEPFEMAVDELGLPKLFWSQSHVLSWMKVKYGEEPWYPIEMELICSDAMKHK